MNSIENIYSVFLKSRHVSTDSRTVSKGDLFFALKGPSFNGNQYAENALKKGAVAAMIDEAQFQKSENCLLVSDTLETLQQLARHHRRQLAIPVIAIAGSNGKTTTKELVNAVLQTRYQVFATQGNYNNEIGVPLTLLRFTQQTQIGVVEMGARQRGDIRVLCDIAEPTHGLITNTGKDHLETFKTLENTLKTNAELYEYLSKVKGIAFVNSADEALMQESNSVPHRITYGNSADAEHTGIVEAAFPYLKISCHHEKKELSISTQLTGIYNLENILAAVAVGRHFNVADENIKSAIEGYAPSNNRSQIIRQNSNTIILDAYNANPSSMKAALENLAAIQSENKVAILGDMLELGEASHDEHQEIVEQIKKMRLTQAVLVGEEFGKIIDSGCLHFPDAAETKKWFFQTHFENTAILLKGSRMIGLERVLGE